MNLNKWMRKSMLPMNMADAKYTVGQNLTEEQAKEIIAYLDDQILISKCHSQRLRYPTIKKWFLAKYPDVAKFGIVEVAKLDENAEEVKSQNVVPFSAAKKTETVEVTDAEAEVITDDIEKVG